MNNVVPLNKSMYKDDLIISEHAYDARAGLYRAIFILTKDYKDYTVHVSGKDIDLRDGVIEMTIDVEDPDNNNKIVELEYDPFLFEDIEQQFSEAIFDIKTELHIN